MEQREIERLLALPFVEVGHGTRRICYRLGASGYCVKFYIPESRYADLHVRPSAQRDIARRRFDACRNSGCQEVAFYHKHWKTLPADISSHLLPVVEKVFHPDYGYGILETYFTNPDNTAIIPYQFELARQKDLAIRQEIYTQAKALLNAIIRDAAYFYEPGNFHVLLLPDGGVTLKIIDFEPTSKTLIPLEMWWAWFRRMKLRRKAKRYLATMRAWFGVKDSV